MSDAAPRETIEATVRRVPRIGVFIALGIGLGVIAAGIITLAGSYDPSPVLNVVYPPTQVFGFMLLWTVPIGLALGAVVSFILERIARRHDRVVRVDRERIIVNNDETV